MYINHLLSKRDDLISKILDFAAREKRRRVMTFKTLKSTLSPTDNNRRWQTSNG